MRWILLGLLIVAVAECAVLWLTRSEAPPRPIDGIEVILTGSNFQPEVLDHKGYVLVDFWFEGCPPCRRMKPVVAHLSVNYRDRVKVGKVDIDQFGELAERYNLNMFPTLLLFQDGGVVAEWNGYGGLDEMSSWLDEQLAAESPPVTDEA